MRRPIVMQSVVKLMRLAICLTHLNLPGRRSGSFGSVTVRTPVRKVGVHARRVDPLGELERPGERPASSLDLMKSHRPRRAGGRVGPAPAYRQPRCPRARARRLSRVSPGHLGCDDVAVARLVDVDGRRPRVGGGGAPGAPARPAVREEDPTACLPSILPPIGVARRRARGRCGNRLRAPLFTCYDSTDRDSVGM